MEKEKGNANVFWLNVVFAVPFIILAMIIYVLLFTQVRFHAQGALDCSSAAFDMRSYIKLNYSECADWIASNCNLNVTMIYCGMLEAMAEQWGST